MAELPPRLSAILDDLLRREGGYVNDPADKGGATNFGISLRYARGIGLDLDGDGDTDAADIRGVTPAVARTLYAHDFWFTPGLDTLPEALAEPVFDMAVNSGPARAIIALQDAINTVIRQHKLALPLLVSDGRIGRRTRAAAAAAAAADLPMLLTAFVTERVQYLTTLAARDPSQMRFLQGWLTRARSFLPPAAVSAAIGPLPA